MATISELAAQLGSDDQTAAFKAKQALNQAVWHTRDADAGAVAKEIAAEYGAKAEGKDEPKYSPKVRSELAQALSLIGSDAEVPALDAAAKASPDREMARWSLDRIPSATSTVALILAARSDVGTEFRVGAISSLGKRTGAPIDVNTALKELAADKELEVRIAALEALANLGDAASDALLAEAIAKGGPDRATSRLVKARIRLGDALLRAGKKDEAKSVFQAIYAGAADEPQKKAAERALTEIG